MTVEWNEGKAIYVQIMEHIRRDVAAGVLMPGQRIPSVREYASTFGVNPNTVQRALHELEREGVLASQRNTGRFVTQSVEKIREMKTAQADDAVREFCSKLKELGYSREEAEAFFRERIKDAFAGDSVRTG